MGQFADPHSGQQAQIRHRFANVCNQPPAANQHRKVRALDSQVLVFKDEYHSRAP